MKLNKTKKEKKKKKCTLIKCTLDYFSTIMLAGLCNYILGHSLSCQPNNYLMERIAESLKLCK